MEVWKPVVGFEEAYAVSNYGAVKRIESISVDGRRLKEKFLHGGCHSNGYEFICLSKDRTYKTHMVHRLVAKAFIPNPNNLPVVNHIDGNIHNNSVDNLEWCTHSENLKHALDIGLMESQCKIRRKVKIRQGERIVLFDSMADCAAYFGFKKGWLQNQIRKHGCIFNYLGWEIEVYGRGIDL